MMDYSQKKAKTGGFDGAAKAGFASALVLAAGLALLPACRNETATRTPPRPDAVATLQSQEPEKKSALAPGREYCFGVTWQTTYGVKIARVGKDGVTADLTFPIGIAEPSANLVSFAVKFNGMKLPENTIRMLEAMTPSKAAENIPVAKPGMGRKCDIPVKASDLRIGRDYFEALGSALSKLSSFYGDSKGRPLFSVAGSNESEILLTVEGGPIDGQTVRLDRAVIVNVEFIAEKAGFFTFEPFRLDKLNVDRSGKVSGTMKANPDSCSSVYMEIFMSEHAGTKPAYTMCSPDIINWVVRAGDSLFPDFVYGGSSVKVTKIDSAGVQLDDGSRWGFGQKRRVGEFAITQTYELKRGIEPGTVVMSISEP